MAPKLKDKQQKPPPPPMEDLFATLNGHIERLEFEKAVKVANQVLAISPGNEDAIKCKVVGLIKDDKTKEALSVIRFLKNPALDFSFFKAYCLYRENELDEALKTLKSQEPTPTAMLLEAQIQKGGFPREKDQVTGLRERIREQLLKYEAPRVLWLETNMKLVPCPAMQNQTKQPLRKDPHRIQLQSHPRLHPSREKSRMIYSRK